MKKTLIVSYTPRVGSNTKKLLDHFINETKNKTTITFLDLAEDAPDLLGTEILNTTLKRNLADIPLSNEETMLIAKNDTMMQQLLETDFIVLAFPMYNYSLPASVKAWVDAVIQAGKTFKMTANGYQGLCEGKQALVLMTTGGDFGVEPAASMNLATPLIQNCLNFMGIPSEEISAFGMQQYPDRVDEILEAAQEKIRAFSKKWYQ